MVFTGSNFIATSSPNDYDDDDDDDDDCSDDVYRDDDNDSDNNNNYYYDDTCSHISTQIYITKTTTTYFST